MTDQDLQNDTFDTIQFQEFALSLKPLALTRCGSPVALQLQPLKLLALLASRGGELVSHEEVRRHLWGDKTVSFNNSIHVYVSQIRASLDDDTDDPKFIENVPRQGYRFLAEVHRVPRGESSRAPEPGFLSGWWRKPWFWGAALGVVLLVAGAAVRYLEAEKPTVETVATEAWDAYQRGIYLLDQQQAAATTKSLDYFEAALSGDPSLAEAHLGAARALGRLGRFEDAKGRALASLELDRELVEAYVVLGLVDMLYEWQWESAHKHFGEALKRDSANAAAHQGIATYYALRGDLESGIAHMRRARRLDPASTIIRADFGWFYYFAGDYEKAATTCAEALDLAPEDSANRHCLIRSLSKAGKHQQAIEHMVQFMEQSEATDEEVASFLGQDRAQAQHAFDRWRLGHYQHADRVDSLSPATLAFAAASAGDFEAALGYVEQALQARSPMIPFIAIDPVFAPYRRRPEFKDVLRRLNLGGT